VAGQRLNDAQSEEVRGLSETSLLLEKSDARVSDRLQLSLDLQHEALDELEIWLSSPPAPGPDLGQGLQPPAEPERGLPTELQSLQPFSAFEGEPWPVADLEVVDSKPGNQGLLNGWSISQHRRPVWQHCRPCRMTASSASIPRTAGGPSLLWLLPLALAPSASPLTLPIKKRAKASKDTP
jgi:subtilisin-like proprotein convertase family protein